MKGGKSMWQGDVRAVEALIEINVGLHRAMGMKSYHQMLDENPSWRGKTFVIAGSGPSLETVFKQNPRLFDFRDDVVWVGINGSLHWVVPDVYMAIDRIMDLRWFDEIKDVPKAKKPMLLTCPMASAKVLGHEWKDRFYFHSLGDCWESDESQALGWLESLNVTMGSAMDFAVRAGAERIILIGADCALAEDGTKYASKVLNGTNPTEQELLRGGWWKVRGLADKPVWVSPEYWATAATLESASRVIEEECGIPVFNCSHHGVLGLNTRWPRTMKMEQALKVENPLSALPVEIRRNGHDISSVERVREGHRVR